MFTWYFSSSIHFIINLIPTELTNCITHRIKSMTVDNVLNAIAAFDNKFQESTVVSSAEKSWFSLIFPKY
jgi:hypothetical protein